jgi:hypothetical protein
MTCSSPERRDGSGAKSAESFGSSAIAFLV